MDRSGTYALVTGAGSAIGAAPALTLAAEALRLRTASGLLRRSG
jgi:NAD(P)-dependent dehydrogenase (short-subunit alcohol dehydrogenase family)